MTEQDAAVMLRDLTEAAAEVARRLFDLSPEDAGGSTEGSPGNRT
jgi:hypothetical protein